jgi:hypothetical protein
VPSARCCLSTHIIRFVQEPKLIVVESFGTRLEAGLAKSALVEAGIDAMIQSDTVGGMREHLAWSGAGFRILVREDDAAAAREVLTSPAVQPQYRENGFSRSFAKTELFVSEAYEHEAAARFNGIYSVPKMRSEENCGSCRWPYGYANFGEF